jgi:pimeloyl-ACP methyl ester carboxylesterase
MSRARQPLTLLVEGVTLHGVRVPSPLPKEGGLASSARGGPVLVLLHDSLGSVGLWRDFPERLAAATGLDVFAYDRQGHGSSGPFGAEARTPAYLHAQAAVLDRVLAAAGIDDAVLLGHSDGGSIALLAAALHPRRVRAVVAEAAHVFVEERTLAGIREAREAVVRGDLLDRLARHHGEKARRLTEVWIDTWLSEAFRPWNVEAELRRIRCPVLVLQGAEDEYGTDAQVHAIAGGVSGPSRAVIFPGLRHTPHREAPEAVLGAVAEFLGTNGLV